MESNQDLINSPLQIDSIAHAQLAETAKWANFLSIVGFILSCLIAVIALFAGAFLGSLGRGLGGGSSSLMGAGFITFIYLVVAAIYFFMSLFLYRFASKMKTALYSNDQDYLNNSFMNLKNVYKLMGILTIIYLGFLALALILGIGSAVMMR